MSEQLPPETLKKISDFFNDADVKSVLKAIDRSYFDRWCAASKDTMGPIHDEYAAYRKLVTVLRAFSDQHKVLLSRAQNPKK